MRSRIRNDGYDHEPNTSRFEHDTSSRYSSPRPSRSSRYHDREPLPRPPLGEDADPYYGRARQTSPSDGGSSNRQAGRERPSLSSPPRSARSQLPSPPRRYDEHSRRSRSARYPGIEDLHESPEPSRRRNISPAPSTKPHRRRYSPSPSPPPRRRAYSPSPGRQHNTRYGSASRDRSRTTGGRSNRYPSPAPSDAHVRSETRSRGSERGREYDRDRRRGGSDRASTAYYDPASADERRYKRGPAAAAAGADTGRSSRSRSKAAREHVANMSPRWQKAATAALQAGGMAMLNSRSEPGSWTGPKGARIATAALGAAALQGFGRETGPDEHEDMGGALGGFLAEKLGNTAKKRVSRSRPSGRQRDGASGRNSERDYGRNPYDGHYDDREQTRNSGRDRYDDRGGYQDRGRDYRERNRTR